MKYTILLIVLNTTCVSAILNNTSPNPNAAPKKAQLGAYNGIFPKPARPTQQTP